MELLRDFSNLAVQAPVIVDADSFMNMYFFKPAFVEISMKLFTLN